MRRRRSTTSKGKGTPRGYRLGTQSQRALNHGWESLEDRRLLAITATIDYSYDTNNFFDTTAKQDILQLAVDQIVSRFEDDLSAISPGGSNSWDAAFFHPATGAVTYVANPTVAANEIVIYAGSRNLSGNLGKGGPGGYSASGSSSWLDIVAARGETGALGGTPTDFGPWGGSIAFDTTTNWHWGETTSGLEPSEFDFYSVALHELAHLFGFGTSDSWDVHVNTNSVAFAGTEAVNQYDSSGDVPLTVTYGHWQSGTTDDLQETAMDPSITGGTRKELTRLDLAGLVDVGWQIDLSAPIEQKVFASDGAMSDWLGYAVAIDGDLAVVGAKLDDDGGSNTGSVYVFERINDLWAQSAKITADNAGANDQFGHAVGISGETIVVGAWLEDTNGNNAGAAYVFERDQGGIDNWGQVAQIAGSDTTAADKFGWSVAISGDTVVVGALDDDPSGSASGAAYVFDRNLGGTDAWGEIAKLGASDAAKWDKFGGAVAISGDTIVVGAYLSDAGGLNSGSAFVFLRDQGGADNWGEIAQLLSTDLAANDQLGYAVGIDGDTIVVGARLNDDVRSSSGSLHMFDRNLGGVNSWGQVAKVTASDPGPGDRLGTSVSISGDLVVGGALFDDDSGLSSGTAYVYERDYGGTDNWGQLEKLAADDASTNDRFGIAVAISGNTAIVGAYLDDPMATNSGSSYLMEIVSSASGGGSLASLMAEDNSGLTNEILNRTPRIANLISDATTTQAVTGDPPALADPILEDLTDSAFAQL